VPMILTIPALCNAVFSPFVGALSDRFGRRPMFLAALTIHFAIGINIAKIRTNAWGAAATRTFWPAAVDEFMNLPEIIGMEGWWHPG